MSTTVKVWLALVVLPQVSVTVQVRVITPHPSTTVLVSLKPTVRVGSHASVAVTTGGAGTAVHSTVALPGTPTSAGATVSSTVIICTQVIIDPAPSVAFQVRVTVLVPGHAPATTTSV